MLQRDTERRADTCRLATANQSLRDELRQLTETLERQDAFVASHSKQVEALKDQVVAERTLREAAEEQAAAVKDDSTLAAVYCQRASTWAAEKQLLQAELLQIRGTLSKLEAVTCGLCAEEPALVILPGCSHKLCTPCNARLQSIAKEQQRAPACPYCRAPCGAE